MVNRPGEREDERAHAALIGEALRSIRVARHMRAADIAKSMNLSVRTYEQLEVGTGRITYSRIVSFANATNSDPVAILAAIPLRSAAFAKYCADNKLMTIVAASLRDLLDTLESDITFLESETLIRALERMCKELIEHVRRRDQFAELWMEDKASKIDGAPIKRA